MKPFYTARPIGSVKALAVALGVSEQVLRDFAASIAEHYSLFSVTKADGSFRDICCPSHELKIIQKRINKSIFEFVKYPDYLFGGIKERDYVKNASHHVGAKCLITLDIRNFYPSIKYVHVFNVFKHFCHFPDDVARLLADLTTLEGVVPQGACTSSHIANLVFFDVEHRLVLDFLEKGLKYSRLLDDICISAGKRLGEKMIDNCVSGVARLLSSRNFKLKKKKTKVTSYENPVQLMEVTGLWLNRGKPRVKRAERINIRSELHRCEKNADVSRVNPDFHKEHSRISGRVAKLTQLDHFEAPNFRERLRKILPLYGRVDVVKTKRLVDVLVRTRIADRAKFSYIERYFKTVYRVNILSRNNKLLAKELRQKMAGCFPTKKKIEVIYGK